ncbi:MAG: head decoration protein [Rudaea sp.]|uniref:head decoration protein n=1 Tax=unclassified Rudaea TaxID=2627037 RepID=UPI0010F60820|nr:MULTISPECIES: head decoration protein [unclassified Rudaea]MBN8887583.1 head decoration protein [Rudaea sp.]
MPVLNETLHAGGFLLSGNYDGSKISVDQIVIASGAGVLATGAVLGKITASGKFTVLAPGASDGSQIAAGILWASVDATSADAVATAVTRDAEVTGGELTWPGGITGPQKTTAIGQLAVNAVVVR